MEPSIQERVSTGDPEGHPMWVRYDGSTRITYSQHVELGDGYAYHDCYDLVDFEEETPLTALTAQ
eukprot:12914166-Prorocentrum_lima.AAC.1